MYPFIFRYIEVLHLFRGDVSDLVAEKTTAIKSYTQKPFHAVCFTCAAANQLKDTVRVMFFILSDNFQ